MRSSTIGGLFDWQLLDIEAKKRAYPINRSGGTAGMAFERIGPYELTRGDLVAASLVISFSMGTTFVRIKAALFVLVGLLVIVAGLAFGEPQTIGFGLLFILFLFVIAPAMRSRKRSKEIYLESDPEGLIAETPDARTTYKWSTIWSVKKVGSRLFIMVSDGCALVVSERSTSRDNMASLMSTVAQKLGCAAL